MAGKTRNEGHERLLYEAMKMKQGLSQELQDVRGTRAMDVHWEGKQPTREKSIASRKTRKAEASLSDIRQGAYVVNDCPPRQAITILSSSAVPLSKDNPQLG